MISLNDVLLAMSNIPVDDPIAEIWGRGLQGGYKIIEYTGALPITINANGDALIDYRIYGADGGVGEPTESGEPAGYKLPMIVANQNLLPDNISQFGNGYIDLYNGGVDSQDAIRKEKYCNYVSIVPNTNYIFVMANGFPGDPLGSSGVKPWRTIAFYKQNKTFIVRQPVQTGEALKSSPVTVTSPSDAFFARVSWRSYGSEECPILATYRDLPVYIGENQLDSVEGVADYVDKASGKIVRMIGEYTFTGDESFNKYGNSDVFYTSKTIDPVGITTVNTITMRCNHPAFTAIENKDTRYWLNPEADDICCFLPGGMSQVFLRSTSNFTTATECKAYLKAQYDNGTPVKISYWLKTPIEEDPPVSFPDIPTIEGETVIDYDGDPKPSQVYIKYKGKG